jgi:hypothetical protein
MGAHAKSGHGALIAWQPSGSGAFVTIAELRDLTTPGLSRNEFDATTQNVDIDTYVLGVLRREALSFSMNFIESGEPTHDHVTGIQKGIIDNLMTGWRYSFPNGLQWIMSGQVQAIKMTDPVDGLQSADVTIRMSGVMSIAGQVIGAGAGG